MLIIILSTSSSIITTKWRPRGCVLRRRFFTIALSSTTTVYSLINLIIILLFITWFCCLPFTILKRKEIFYKSKKTLLSCTFYLIVTRFYSCDCMLYIIITFMKDNSNYIKTNISTCVSNLSMEKRKV